MNKLICMLIIFFDFFLLGMLYIKPQSEEHLRHIQFQRNLMHHFPWMKGESYWYLRNLSRENEQFMTQFCSVIYAESGQYCSNDWECMQSAVSHAGAIGVCQVMPFHVRDSRTLYNWKVNIGKGIWYFSKCMSKAENDLREGSRMYNQGLYGKRWIYDNWKYVNKIEKKYMEVINGLNN